MKFKRDHFLTGFLPGLILPLIGFYTYYLIFFAYMGIDAFIKHLERINMIVSVLSLGVILNLIIFFVFYQIEDDHAARGVIAATLIYGFVVLYVKIF